MNKKIIAILGAFVLLLSGFYFTFINSQESSIDVKENQINQENINTPSTTTEKSTETKTEEVKITPNIKTTLDMSWAVFQKYLSANKEANLSQVKSIVYKVSEICSSETPSEDCKKRMESAYSYGSTLVKEEFKNVWFDDQQIILATDFWTEESEEIKQYGRFRSIIFFIKQDGTWKLLSFSPFKGSIVSLDDAKEKVIELALLQTKDEDKDGLPDYEESCPSDKTDTTCKKTDPTKRDSNNNGLWDGIETLMNKNF